MPITVKRGSKKALADIKELWREVFRDGDFADIFISKFYRPSRAFLAYDGKKLVSMLFYMDVGAKYFKKKIKCAYLYGVATRMSERGQGYFHTLHDAFMSAITARGYDVALVIPASESLFATYRSLGYTLSAKKQRYGLLDGDIKEVFDLDEIWQMKKNAFRKQKYGLGFLETREQFIVSREGHRFFSHGDSILAFSPKGDGFELYEVISPEGSASPVQLEHYERSALICDLKGQLDAELIEKQRVPLSYLLN